MKKILIIFLLVISGCQSGKTSIYDEKEKNILDKAGVLDTASNDCNHPESVKVMLKGDFKKENIRAYCGLKIKKEDGVNVLIDKKITQKQMQTYLSLPNFHGENVDRYLNQEADSIKEKVLKVNMNLDLVPYSVINTIEDDSDLTLLINKYNALPNGYIPSDLVDVKYVCTLGKDFSCSEMGKMQLREKAAKAYEAFVEEGQKNKINIVAIATYRSYNYQANLYNYYLNLNGLEYADAYYARPGQSEHNSGLAVDITFNDHRYDEIEKHEGYDWILKNMHKFGFILRYPEAKTDITQYGYESWHLRYVGKDLATKLYKDDLTLEEYYGGK